MKRWVCEFVGNAVGVAASGRHRLVAIGATFAIGLCLIGGMAMVRWLTSGSLTRRGPAPITLPHGATVSGMSFSADGRFLAALGVRDVRLWNVATWTEEKPTWMAPHRTPGGGHDVGFVACAALSDDGAKLAIGYNTGGFAIFDTLSGAAPASRAHLGEYVWSVRFSPNGQLLAVTTEDRTIVYDLASSRMLTIAKRRANVDHSAPSRVNDLANDVFSRNGKYLATAVVEEPHRGIAGRSRVLVWTVEDWTLSRTFAIRGARVQSMAFSPDGQLFTTGDAHGTVRLWRLRSGKLVWAIPAHIEGVSAAVYTPDGRSLVTASNAQGKVTIWDVRLGKERRSVDLGPWGVFGIALAPSGQFVAVLFVGQNVIGDVRSGVKVYQLPEMALRVTYVCRRGLSYGIAWSPDERLLAIGNSAKTVDVWDVARDLTSQ